MAYGKGYVFNPRTRVIGEGYRFNPHTGVIAFGDDVVVTDHQPRAPRPDNTGDMEAAEDRAQKTIKDLDAGLVSRRTATGVKHAAKRAIGGYDVARSVGKL